ncbi:hypothetical protein ABIB66_006877 [Bradyrhizobium sp. F1.13.3]
MEGHGSSPDCANPTNSEPITGLGPGHPPAQGRFRPKKTQVYQGNGDHVSTFVCDPATAGCETIQYMNVQKPCG